MKKKTRRKRERERRKTNVIIHGLPEPTASTAEDRRNEDCDLAQDLLHKLSCDDVSINHITRLGPPPTTDSDNKPRPVKLNLASPESRNRVLRNSKNLRSFPDSLWKSVFVHQDLTPKEKEARKILVQELKARKLAGEVNLIIVNGKIVNKRSYSY